MNIPFNKPYYTGKELEYIGDAILKNKICGDGYYTKKVNSFIEEKFRTLKALFVTSGSSALDMAALLLNLKEGDEVIVPSFTFVSTANAPALRGAKIVFCEIEPQTMNMDLNDVEKKINQRTRAIFAVHYGGISCDMDRLLEISNKYNIKIVEDAAQAVNSKYKGKYLGTLGDMGCYSFHETKNYVCGEGGAILINKDAEIMERAEIIREKGTNRTKFYRGEIDKYTWVDIGSSYIASDILAAFLYAQFEKLDNINEKRKKVFNYYYENLKHLAGSGRIGIPYTPEYSESNYHMFYIILKDENERNSVMDSLKKSGIYSVFHYIPLHTSTVGKKMGYREGDLPVTEEYAGRLLRLPMYADLTEIEQEYIIEKLYNILKQGVCSFL